MKISPRIAAVLLLTGAAGTHAVPERWQLRVVGPATEEQGELRIEGVTARLLLESDDSAFQVLADFRLNADSIAFTVPHDRRRFVGTITSTTMQGAVRNPDGTASRWDASRMPANAKYWPVRPRVTVRQLETGSTITSEKIPGAWIAALADTATLGIEYRQLAREAGVIPADGVGLSERPRRAALGLDSSVRVSARRVMEGLFTRFINEPTAATLFHRQDVAGVLVDIHDYAGAMGSLGAWRIRALARSAGLPSTADSAAVREYAWRTWERAQKDTAWARAMTDTIHEEGGDVGRYDAFRGMLAQYSNGKEWWPEAVHWLLTRRWIDTPQGPRSPAQLVAAFWGVDSLPLPAITPELFGDFVALPVFSAARLGDRFVLPRNASAREWLPQGGMAEAVDAWRDVQFGWPEPLPMSMGDRSVIVTSPSGLNRTHGGAFLAGSDAIKIDPGIVPILAVVTVIHEWQHLLLAARRFEGTAPGLTSSSSQLKIREDDPWLAEGAAEWITEQIFAQARKSVPLLAMFDAEKRYAIGNATPDDPHALGYRLVRAVAKGKAPATVREWLVRYLGDPAGLARVAGLAGRGKVPPMVLRRPATASVIPEVTFTWDDGIADLITRRLIIPTRPLEH